MHSRIDSTAFGVASESQDANPTPQASLKSSERVIPLTQWNDYHSWPPQGGLRHLVFNASTNGFSRVVRRGGRRVLLHEGEFFRWLDHDSGAQE